ncbi:MAG TPA: cysteine peptidase family C39 domain-containing protein [Rectinemataceae bacterium]|nr:cysteine peptidase family C39 domain-containing protein [Rectinemataceae bacterium]
MFIKLAIFLLAFAETIDKESLRFAYSAEQGYDRSCGLTTLACLMDRFWGVPADETALAKEFLADKLATGDLTVTFAEMARILEARGFAWKAYRMSFGQLAAAAANYAPLIVHYDRPEGHFALVLSLDDGAITISDPAEGTIALGRALFESKWSGAVLVAVRPKGALNAKLLDEAGRSVRGRKMLLDRAARGGTRLSTR